MFWSNFHSDGFLEGFDDKENNVVGHLPKGKSGKYAKTIFYFLRSDPLNSSFVKVTGKAMNMGDDKGMQIPCLLEFSGNGESIQLLKNCFVHSFIFTNKDYFSSIKSV